MTDSLLIEILTEELPPKSLARLSRAFSGNVFDGLKGQGFVTAHSEPQPYATPRRLAVLVSDVLAKQPDRIMERRGPSVSTSFDNAGKPTPALLGFARSCGVKPDKLKRHAGDKGEYFVYRAKRKGEPLKSHLADIVESALKRLPVSKLMRWGSGEVQFVRPVHGLVMLHGTRVVPGTVLGIKSGRKTLGHRFMSRGPLAINNAGNYQKILAQRGRVIVDYGERVKLIERQLDDRAKRFGKSVTWSLGKGAELIQEVAGLAEYPVVYAGGFDKEFLTLPGECLIVSMQEHQRYFPLALTGSRKENQRTRLLADFLFVGNIKTGSPRHIIHGNERVLKARLSDAKFFFDQDRKTRLADRVPMLAKVVYHNKLGSQLERVERIVKLSAEIARGLAQPGVKRLGEAEIPQVKRAAYLCKADLLTEMVGEFPELQGIMGNYYARHDGEPAPVADAIEQHYFPKMAGGPLPAGTIAECVALADRLDTLVGIYGIGLVPTGEKDPFGLRRQALGATRILMEKPIPLDIVELLQQAQAAFPAGLLAEDVVQNLYGFMLDRLKPYLREKDFLPDEIEAVLSLNPKRLDQVLPRLQALQKFRKLPQAQVLAAANKRIRNILRQAGGAVSGQVDETLLKESAERELAGQVRTQYAETMPLLEAGEYAQVLTCLASLRPVVDKFFDEVMVMVDDISVRNNRLALLDSLNKLFMQVADISRLQS